MKQLHKEEVELKLPLPLIWDLPGIIRSLFKLRASQTVVQIPNRKI
jgi:hypothetical protein